MGPLYSGLRNFVLYKEVTLSQGLIYTKRVHLRLSEVVFMQGCPHVRGGLYEGFHCISNLKLALLDVFFLNDN